MLTVAPCIGTDQMGPKRFGAKGKLAFSFGNVAQDEGAAMAEWAYKQKGWRTADLATNNLLAYFKQIVQAFKSRFTQLGGKINGEESYTSFQNDFGNAVSRLNGEKADVIVTSTSFGELPGVVNGLRSLGNNTPILNSWAGDGTYWTGDKPKVTNYFAVTYASIAGDDPNPAVNLLAKQVKAFEIKLSQGAKPGKGGVLPGGKVTQEIARIRGIPAGQDSISPNRHRDAANIDELLDQVAMVRALTGRPVGIKTAIGGWHFLNDMADTALRRGLEYAPDFLVIDGGEGGSGAAPQALFDHMSLSIEEALPRAADVLYESGLKERVRLVASGKLITSARAAWALCVGADFVNTARGFMFSLGCIQALRCHTNTCPTGITTHNPRLQRGLVVQEKFQRVANYAMGMNKDIEMIAHACGVAHPRLLRREHCRIVQANGATAALNMLYPYPKPNANARLARVAAAVSPAAMLQPAE